MSKRKINKMRSYAEKLIFEREQELVEISCEELARQVFEETPVKIKGGADEK